MSKSPNPNTEVTTPIPHFRGKGSGDRGCLGLWLITLFAVEEIPSAMVTFVALLMFLQMGIPVWEVTLFSAILFLPWVFKSWLRSMVRRAGQFRRNIHLCEVLLCLSLGALAFALPNGKWWTLSSLFVVSLLCSWHELLARMYYERMLRPRLQRLFIGTKSVSSQIAVVLTYGLMIIGVGTMQIFFKQKSPTLSWSFGCYIMAGVFLFFTMLHFLILKKPFKDQPYSNNTVSGSLRAELHIIERIGQQQGWWKVVLMLWFMLLPQGLMFYSRTLFLMAKTSAGGLGCTLQEVGFAQGTVGVIAFLLGISGGRVLMKYIPEQKLFWVMTICLGLSPALYLLMSYEPPSSLAALCMATFQAQILFGFGLNACSRGVRYISGERYRNTVNLLYIPLIAFCMLIPMAASGFMLEHMSYKTFFLIDVLSAPIGWAIIKICQPLSHRAAPFPQPLSP